MPEKSAPEEVVQRQLEAYNAHDLAGWLATYADDARQFEYPATLLADGIQAIRERAIGRFAEPNLHAHLRERSVIGNVVIDHEDVTRTFPEGPGTMELVAIYQVVDGKIKTVSFISFAKQVH
ncbi:MAG TPA: nuclear transport factor 2 family protein [Candidatus Acidoferrales bacterium]|nr:nuclear transport factor 2 family protein [Candidatus Acidoferrales bacterium]